MNLSFYFTKVKEVSLAGLGPEAYQVALDLRDPKVYKGREALLVVQVTQDMQGCLGIKVSLCIHQILWYHLFNNCRNSVNKQQNRT